MCIQMQRLHQWTDVDVKVSIQRGSGAVSQGEPKFIMSKTAPPVNQDVFVEGGSRESKIAP